MISGNSGDGVYVNDSGTTANVVEGDYIGTDPSGLHSLANNWGVFVTGGATNNTFGGTSAAARDLISGNAWTGLELNGSGHIRQRRRGRLDRHQRHRQRRAGEPRRRRGDLAGGQLQHDHRRRDLGQQLRGRLDQRLVE